LPRPLAKNWQEALGTRLLFAHGIKPVQNLQNNVSTNLFLTTPQKPVKSQENNVRATVYDRNNSLPDFGQVFVGWLLLYPVGQKSSKPTTLKQWPLLQRFLSF